VTTKSDLRKTLRRARREHVSAQPAHIRALLFHRPPGPLLAAIDADAVIGLYHATGDEAPAGGYARFFQERGHRLALPRFADAGAPMEFAEHTDPFDESDLVPGPFGLRQPGPRAPALVPDVLFVPLIGFTASGSRLGQGGGHYDRWIAERPGALRVGMAWDVQLIEPEDALPLEPHDMALDCIVTPTRIYGNP
jgi:5-formyltetrahydrofolate cyclo-ligase